MKLRDRIARQTMQPSRCYRQTERGILFGNDLRSHWYWNGDILGSLDSTASFAGAGSTVTIYYSIAEDKADVVALQHPKIKDWLNSKGVVCRFEVTVEAKGYAE